MRMSPSGSMDWITTLDSYRKWYDTHGVSFLYIYGRPGSGATVFTSHIIRLLHSKSAETKLCYLSFSFNEQDAWASSSESVVLSFVRQVLSKRPRLFQHTRCLCTWITEKNCINLQSLWILFGSLLSHMIKDQVVVAIRANEKWNSVISNIIDQLLSLRGLPNLDMKVIIISKEPSLDQRDSTHFHHIKLEEEERIKLAVKALVRRRVQRLLNLRPAWRELQEEITETIWTSAPNYYWAMAKVQELEIESSMIVSSKAAILDRFEGFSSSIDRSFQQMVQKIPKSSHWWLHEALRWVLYALRPLSSSELAVAVAFITDASLQTVQDRIFSDLPGDINRIAGYWVKVEGGRVEVTNTALKTFLINNYMENESVVHATLLKKCLRYISWVDVTLGSHIQRGEFDPHSTSGTQCDFLDYAALYWPYHFDMACSVGSDVMDEVMSFLGNSDHLRFWSRIVRQHRPHIFSTEFLTSPIQVSAIFGLGKLLDRVLDTAAKSTRESWLALIHESMNLAIEQGHEDISLKLHRKMQKLGMPPQLHKAAERGFVSLVEEILGMDSVKTSIDIPDVSGYTPLLYAAQFGHKEIVELLLGNDANPHFAAINDTKSTALHLASRIGQVEIVRILIRCGADPKVSDSFGYNPLKFAAEGGFDELARLLIPYHKGDTEEENGRTNTPIHLAAMYGHTSTCTYLIEQGLKVNVLNKDIETPLHLAVRGGFRETVQTLLEAGSRVSSSVEADPRQSLGSKSPIQIAAQMGYVEIMSLLLDKECFTTSAMNDLIGLAAEAGHWDALNLLLQKTTMQNPLDSDGNTALHIASKNGHVNLVSKLLNSGRFDQDFRTRSGMAAMHLAAQEGHDRVVTTFVNNGVALDCMTSGGDMAIHFASRNGHLSVVKALQAIEDMSDEMDHEGNTPLILAAMGRHISVVKEFLSAAEKREEADPNITWKSSYILHKAVSIAYEEFVCILIDHGYSVDSLDSEGQAPIHIAAEGNSVPIIKLLIKCGANLRVTNRKYETALCLAVKRRCFDACKAIVESSQDNVLDFINIEDENSNTPLFLACISMSVELTQLLLERKADPNWKCSAGWTPLHKAASLNRIDVADLLLKKSADHSIRNDNGFTPVLVAAESGCADVLRFLLGKQADPNVMYSIRTSALHGAAKGGFIECVKLLVDAGADYNLQNENGLTPLHCAIMTSHNDIVRYLVQIGADVFTKSHRARSALEFAMRRSDFDAANILIAAHATMLVDASQVSRWDDDTLVFALEHPNAFIIASRGEVLQHAISGGSEKAALVLMNKGMDLNEKVGFYCTALQAAAYSGSFEILEDLLARGAEHGIVGGQFGTALNAAVISSRLEVVELLLNKGADPDAKDLRGRSPLMNAVIIGELDLVEKLLEWGAEPDVRDSEGRTPLMRAVTAGSLNKKMVVTLLRRNADPSLRDCRGRGALYWACLNGLIKLARKHILPALQNRGDQSFQGQLAFHAATSLIPETSSETQLDILGDLLERKFDLTETDLNGWSALYTAERYRFYQGVERLTDEMFVNGINPVSLTLVRPSKWHRQDAPLCLQVSEDGRSVLVTSKFVLELLPICLLL